MSSVHVALVMPGIDPSSGGVSTLRKLLTGNPIWKDVNITIVNARPTMRSAIKTLIFGNGLEQLRFSELRERPNVFDVAIFNSPIDYRLVENGSIKASRNVLFLQDYDPDFYAAGYLKFQNETMINKFNEVICLGSWVSRRVRENHAIKSVTSVPFFRHESLKTASQRRDIDLFIYNRGSTPRRGGEYLNLIKKELSKEAPNLKIFDYGAQRKTAILTPDNFERIIFRSRFSLSLSYTNISLLPLQSVEVECMPFHNVGPSTKDVLSNISYLPITHELSHDVEFIIDNVNNCGEALRNDLPLLSNVSKKFYQEVVKADRVL